MNSNPAVYWIVLGALALGLNSEYRRGGLPGMHQAVERADAALCRMASRAERTVAMARMMWNAEMTPAPRAEWARLQAEIARERMREEGDLFRQEVRERIHMQADMARARADMERARFEQVQVFAGDGLGQTVRRQVVVVCPKIRARVVVDPPQVDEF